MKSDHGVRPDLPKASGLGLILFAVYLVFYGAFVAVAAFHGEWLARTPWQGVNTAIHWGFLLIVVPLALALVYLRFAGKAED